MRIFQIITVSEYGGAQTIVADLIKSLCNEHEVFVLYGGEGEAWSKLGDQFKRIRLCKHRKTISLWDFILLIKLFYYRLRYNPDIVHLHSSKMGVLGRIAFSRSKTILTMHGFDSVLKGYSHFIKVEKALKNRARLIVGVSQYDVDQLKKEGISKNVIRIYNGVEDYYNTYEHIDIGFEEKLINIKTQFKHTVMCIARISKQKKFDLFIDTAKAMPDYAFVWIGNKEIPESLPANVFCMGEVYAAYNYLRHADIFMLPSNYEGLPISLLEALSFSLPSVASAVGGITEVLDSKNGFAVRSNTVDEFKEKIEYIVSDSVRYKSMSDYARSTYITNFTIEKMVNSYKTIYKDIVAHKK